MKASFLTLLCGFATVLAPLSVSADAQADKILATTRYAATMQTQQDLHGYMSKNGKRTPLSLFLRNENIQFSYKVMGNDNRFHMRLEDDHYDLLEIRGGKTTRFSDSKLSESINGTDVSYEDLSMRFLYWKDTKLEGEEKVNGQLCYKLRLTNPSKTAGEYRIVYVWVHKKYGAMMKLIGYNSAGKPLKQFLVTDLMRMGKDYTLRTMRVSTVDPKSNKTTGITYLEFKKAKKAEGKKTR
ncbi:MAG: outer membrane lipoprotein-sorting protein [Rubritalea sp.]|uniref:outer membrane lipoprotein-sorting protein n=1 Tax=Rubritalea sp. TaxID=2109375 RepID=UPI0032423DC5